MSGNCPEVSSLCPDAGATQGIILRATDFALGVAVPVHAHVAINSVISDYVPKSVMGASALLLGLLKLNLTSPGTTSAVGKLRSW